LDHVKSVWCETFWHLENVHDHWTMKKVRNAFYNSLKKERTIGPCKESHVTFSDISRMCKTIRPCRKWRMLFLITCKWTGPLDHAESWISNLLIIWKWTGPLDHVVFDVIIISSQKWTGPLDHAESWISNLLIIWKWTGPLDHVSICKKILHQTLCMVWLSCSFTINKKKHFPVFTWSNGTAHSRDIRRFHIKLSSWSDGPLPFQVIRKCISNFLHGPMVLYILEISEDFTSNSLHGPMVLFIYN
jgi:hypothetical protein